jgi:hypothetical protein
MAAASLSATAAVAAASAVKLIGGKEDGNFNKRNNKLALAAHGLSSSFAFGCPLASPQARRTVSMSTSSRRGRREGAAVVHTRAMAKELYFNKDGSATKKMQVIFVFPEFCLCLCLFFFSVIELLWHI